MGKKRKRNQSPNELDVLWNSTITQNCQLPDGTQTFLNDEEVIDFMCNLSVEKQKLNTVKSSLNSIDIIKWRSHTSKTHKYGFVTPSLKYKIKTELVTQAWSKFYTILSSFELLPLETSTIYSVHLCEAPGAFVTSLNHFIQLRSDGKQKLDWIATTLNPYYEGNNLNCMIPDDRFIVETLPNWNFGPDFTGDIMSETNLNGLKDRCQIVDLVTADGSIDCSENPGEQENIVSLLFLWEVVTALNILSDNGCFVMKIFTVFEPFTISMLYLLKSLFVISTLCKPGPSKPGNSEVYVVNQGFKKDKCLSSTIFQQFVSAAFKMDPSLCTQELTTIPKDFLFTIKDCVSSSCVKQSEAIQKNVELYDNLNTIEELELKKLKNQIANLFLKKFRIHSIHDFLSPVSVCKRKHVSENCLRKQGSYNDRQQKHLPEITVDNTESETKMNILKGQGNTGAFWYLKKSDFFNFENFQNFCFISGKSFQEIMVSYFCSVEQLQKWKQTLNAKCDEAPGELQLLVSHMGNEEHSQQAVGYIKNYMQTVEQSAYNSYNPCSLVCSIELSKKKNTISTLINRLSEQNDSLPCLILQLDHIPVTFFNVGLCFLFAQCCQKTLFCKPEASKNTCFMIYLDFDMELLEYLCMYLKRLKDTLNSLENDMDVLHIVPIFCLLQSNFKEYISTQIKQGIDQQTPLAGVTDG